MDMAVTFTAILFIIVCIIFFVLLIKFMNKINKIGRERMIKTIQSGKISNDKLLKMKKQYEKNLKMSQGTSGLIWFGVMRKNTIENTEKILMAVNEQIERTN